MTAAYYEIVQGDALALLRGLPDASVDAVITDPPYSSGGMVRGDRTVDPTSKYRGWSQDPNGGGSVAPASTYATFTGDNRDQRGYAYWCTLWLGECMRVAKPGASLLMFTDWRQLPTTTDIVQSAGWVWRGIAVWDKGVGRPMRGRFRNHVEYLVWGTAGATVGPQDVYLDSVMRYAPPRTGTREHLTQKPVDLLRYVMALVPKGGTVLDPFAGSGTTGVAALMEGRRFLGFEITEHYAQVARDRCAQVADGFNRDNPSQGVLL